MQPWEHQRRVYDFMLNRAGGLEAVVMGAGKTKITIDVVQNRGHKRILIVCPRAVVTNWPVELEKHMVLDYRVLALRDGTTAARSREALEFFQGEDPRMRFAVVNYDALRSSAFSEMALRIPWDCVIYDESHHLKAPGGVTSKFTQRLSHQALQRIGMSGTPMADKPLDIYAQARSLDENVFGTSYAAFRHKYAVWDTYTGYKLVRYINQDDFARRFNLLAIEVGEEVLDLPAENHINRYCDISPAARGIYERLENDAIYKISEDEFVTAANVLVELLRLQQLTGGFITLDNSKEVREVDTAKYELLVETLDELPADEPVVVFAYFSPELANIHKAASQLGRQSLELSGAVDQLADWKAGLAPVLAVQVKAGAEGVDMTRAAYSIYYSTGVSLGTYDQSRARIHRPGQTRPQRIVHLHAKDTVDSWVEGLLHGKKNVVQEFTRHIRENRRAARARDL